MSTSHAWDVYAESLTYLGYGYPLPYPDTRNQDRPWEIEIGDVGWLSDGQFCPLIRTTAMDDAQQPHGRSPEGYVPFDMSKAVIGKNPERILERVLHSRKIQATTISAGLSVSASPAELDAGGHVTFKSSEDRGGLLVLRPRGEETINRSAVLVKKYLRSHFEEWVKFANDEDGLGIGLEPEDIIFVAGVIKTVDWGVAAFLSHQHMAEGSLSCSFGGVGSATISLTVTNSSPTNHWKRAGPSAAWRLQQLSTLPVHSLVPLAVASTTSPHAGPSSSLQTHDASSPAIVPTSGSFVSAAHPLDPGASPADPAAPPLPPSPPKADQCIFFHYYKLKRRGILMLPPQFQLKAGARPHELPQNPGGPDTELGVLSDSVKTAEGEELSEFGMMPPNNSQHFDPVNAALDYILENSNAVVAIASDLDLYALFKDPNQYPRDIASALIELQPPVDVDELGVGFFSEGVMSEPKEELQGGHTPLIRCELRDVDVKNFLHAKTPSDENLLFLKEMPAISDPPSRFDKLSRVINAVKRHLPKLPKIRSRREPRDYDRAAV